MPQTFCERLIACGEKYRDKVAMRIVGLDAETYTFGEMLDAIRSIAYRLEQEGIAFGDRVVVMGENHPSWAIAYLGTLYRGAVAVPLDPHGEIETITNFFENSEAKLAFLSPDQTERFAQIEERLDHSVKAVIWDESPNSFSDWLTTEFPDSFAAATPKAKDSDMALLMYTSGTTGTPKGVPLTHGNIAAELDGINEILHLTADEKILSLLPLFHAYLQIVNLWVAATYGCEVGYLKELTPAELGEAMKSFKPTILTTVPRLWYLFHKKIFDAVAAKPRAVRTLFRAMLKTNAFFRNSLGIDLGSKFFGQVHESFGGDLRLAVSAGSRFDEDVAIDFNNLGFTILQGYGLTETSGAATATFENDNVVGSVGKALKGIELRLDNKDKDGVGEVMIRGAMVFDGYYKNPEATKEAFTGDGWFHSGDLGRFDDEGHLYIVGRAKDVIVLPSGKNVHPEDLEVHYLKNPYVAELAVIGIEDKSEAHAGAEKLAAIVVPDFERLKAENIANSKEMIRHTLDTLGRDLPEYQRVRKYIIRIEPLPRTATRKIKRFQLKKELETGVIASQPEEKQTWTFTDADLALLDSPAGQAVVSAIRAETQPSGSVLSEPPASAGGGLLQAETRPGSVQDSRSGIHPSMNLEIDLGLDSLSRAETFAALEMRLGTEFSAEDAAKALTVRDLIGLVKNSPPYQGGVAAASADGVVLSNETSANWHTILTTADEDMPELRTVLKNRPFFAVFAWSVYKCFNLFCRIFMRLEVKGMENLEAACRTALISGSPSEAEPRKASRGATNFDGQASLSALQSGKPQKSPAFLICPNHQSFLDPFVLCSNYPYGIFKNTFHVGASEFFGNRFMAWLKTMLQIVPVDPDTKLMRAMKASAIGLKHGKILNIYPEGERAFDGDLHPFKKGAAILATELDMPIIPVAIDGMYKVWPRGSWRIRPAKVKIHIGQPFFARDVTRRNDDGKTPDEISSDSSLIPHPSSFDDYDLVTQHLKSTIASMLAEMREHS